MNKKLLSLAVITALSIGFTACGGGEDDTLSSSSSKSGEEGSVVEQPAPTSITKTIDGKAVDGNINNANVCLDINFNNICDSSEPSTTTNYYGNFTLTTTEKGNFPIIMTGGTDTATNKSFTGTLKNIVKIEDNQTSVSAMVTPITTLSANIFTEELKADSNYTIESAKQTVASNLGLTLDQVDENPMEDKVVFEKAQQIMQSINLLSKSIQIDQSDATKNKNAFDHVMQQLSLSVKDDTNASDLNVSKLITKLETTQYEYKTISIPSDIKDFTKKYVADIKEKSKDVSVYDLDDMQKGFENFVTTIKDDIDNNTTENLSDKISDFKDTNTSTIITQVQPAQVTLTSKMYEVKEFKTFADDGNKNSNYTSGTKYMHLIPFESRKKVSIDLGELKLAEGDSLSIYNGDSANSYYTDNYLVGIYKNGDNPPKFTATNSNGELVLKFYSNSTLTAEGFEGNINIEDTVGNNLIFAESIRYTIDENATLTDNGGIDGNYTLDSVDANNKYVHLSPISNTKKVSIDFGELKLADGDTLSIYNDDYKADSYTLVGTYKNGDNPPKFTSTRPDGKLLLKFHSNANGRAEGFEANVTKEDTVGNNLIFAKSVSYTIDGNATLTDNGGIDGNYTLDSVDANNKYVHLSPVSNTKKVSIDFGELKLADGDTLTIYDDDSTSNEVGTYINGDNPPKFTATNSDGKLTLKFHSNGTGRAEGFEANVSQVTP